MNVFVNNIEDKDALHTLVLKELRENGIKYQKTKKRQLGQDKSGSRRIFRIPLHQLELTDVFLVNGSIVQVPQFVSDACQRILEEVTTEGLFRKAGATARQKGIRALLENGQCLEKSHHVIDVANVLKSFFRELPEALLPRGNIQDAMLRCLFTEHKLNTLLLTCLLLPPLTLNLLTFFMQFLHTVALHSDQNRMTIQNLAIIFTPSLMPLPEMYPTRLENYVKIIEMLIENSDRIGIVPERFVKGHQTTEAATLKEEKKRKKRRSGSLTRVFNGLKKIVGVRGSADDLDKCIDVNPVTPCLTKSTKKRKAAEQVGMSAKKKKQIMALLPNGSLLPSTPMITKDNKKLRLSFGSSSSRRITKFPGVEPPETITESHIELPQMERRWSVVGTPIKNETTGEFDGDTTKYFSPVVSLPCLTFNPDVSGHQDMGTSTEFASVPTTPEKTGMNVEEEDKDYVKISKSEYQALNERVAAIEARISQEFSLPTAVATLPADAELVQDVYEQTLEETESLSPPATDELARRLSRDLKIRRSGEGRIFRSPSARKIGTIRRRSRESAARVTRTKSWHVGSSGDRVKLAGDLPFYPPKGALKRGRPNTVQSGLRHPSPAATVRSGSQVEAAVAAEDHEMWTSAEEFFVGQPQMETDDEKIVFITEKKKEMPAFGNEEQRMVLRSAATVQEDTEVISPRFKTKIAVSGTPMLPPRGIPPKRTTPRAQKAFPKTPFEQQQQQLPPTGRASIARLRSQNAGMVAAKAKLFDGMSGEEGRTGRPPDVEDATPKRVGRCPRSQRLCDVDASRALRPVNADGGGRTFLKPPVIKPAPLENTPRRLVKVPARLHSPNTPMRAFRANSRSPRVPRNYRSPRH